MAQPWQTIHWRRPFRPARDLAEPHGARKGPFGGRHAGFMAHRSDVVGKPGKTTRRLRNYTAQRTIRTVSCGFAVRVKPFRKPNQEGFRKASKFADDWLAPRP